MKPQTGAQTVVVPQGPVAAGAEIAAEETGNATTVAAGAGLAAVLAAVGAAFLIRRRAQR
ncbi:LPXTG cell wall anchor domain-containing protein [Streptomyces cirratus]